MRIAVTVGPVEKGIHALQPLQAGKGVRAFAVLNSSCILLSFRQLAVRLQNLEQCQTQKASCVDKDPSCGPRNAGTGKLTRPLACGPLTKELLVSTLLQPSLVTW